MPFSRSYSAGGSNEIRAWRTFDLGPGGEMNNLEYKVGTFKLVGNIEYRFKLTNKFNAALFIDAGNIWDITNSNLVTEEGKFTSLSSLKTQLLDQALVLDMILVFWSSDLILVLKPMSRICYLATNGL